MARLDGLQWNFVETIRSSENKSDFADHLTFHQNHHEVDIFDI